MTTSASTSTPTPTVVAPAAVPVAVPVAAPVDVIQSLYAAFGAGDIASAVGLVAPDADWGLGIDSRLPGADVVHVFDAFHGQTGAGQYFAAVAEAFEIHRFEVHGVGVVGDQVVGLIELEVTLRATGRRVTVTDAHVFHVNTEGLIDRYRPHVDTATLLAAAIG